VIDLTKGVEPQTEESIEILKSRRTSFVVAANKLDLVPGWRRVDTRSLMEAILQQPPETQREIENRLYMIMGSMSKLGLNADRFDRIRDFTKTIAIVPTSARTGDGIRELLAVVIGLTQSYMEKELLTSSGPARGTVLEVKEEVGLGVTVNGIIYDGSLSVGDEIVLGGKGGPIVTVVRAILVPKPLDEIRDPRERFSSVRRVDAAAGIKIVAPNLEEALAGSSIYAVPKGQSSEAIAKIVKEEFDRLRIETDRNGIVLKTDTLGALEAITASLNNTGTPIRIADVGDISKRDIIEAAVVREKDRFLGVVLGFNVRVLPDAEEEAIKRNIKILRADVIYDLLEGYSRWVEDERAASLKAELDRHIRPGKMRVLPGYIFRHSKPAIFGVEVMAGTIRQRYPIIRQDGKRLGTLLRLQEKGRDIDEAKTGMQIAVSVDKAVINRNVSENDILYVAVPEASAREFSTRLRDQLNTEEKGVLDELISIMRRENPLWCI
jgi:translation initiation factor 5B